MTYKTFVSVACLGLALAGCNSSSSEGDDNAGGTGGSSNAGSGGGGSGGSGGGSGGAMAVALATLTMTSATIPDVGASMAGGTVVVRDEGAMTRILINVNKATPGDHGVHIHMNGSCSDTTADGSVVAAGGAGPHWNPTSMKHGQLGSGMHHAGDLGNITVGANGIGSKTVMTTEWKAADVVGKAVVLHAGADDLATDPAGNSGARIACGVFAAGK